MKTLKRWVVILLLLLVLLITTGFSIGNNIDVPLSFGPMTLEARPLSLWIISAFSLGVLSGLTLGAGLINNFRLNRRIRQLEKELLLRPRFGPAEKD
jgi:uncharacterized integral membrane protein